MVIITPHAVHSRRWEEDGSFAKVLAGEFPSCHLITSNQNKLASNRGFGVNFPRWSLNIRLLYNNSLTDRLISDQNLPFADFQARSSSFRQTVLWKDIWLLGNEVWVSMFLETWNLFCWKWMLEYLIKQYQQFLSKLIYKGKSWQKEL